MAEKAIKPHLKKVLQQYLNTVKNADKSDLEKPFTADTTVYFVHAIENCIGSSLLLGRLHAEEERTKAITAADEEIPPIKFEEAIDFLKSKVPLTKKQWLDLEPKLRFRAFTVAKLGEAKAINSAKEILVKALEDGTGYAETWEELKKKVNTDALEITPGYWENVFRTNTQSAYIAGKLQQYEAFNDIKAYQLFVIEDSRTSRYCRNLLTSYGRGFILPIDHKFWKEKGFPPYHFQCRTSIRAIFGRQIARQGLNVDNPTRAELNGFKPMKGFGGRPEWWELTESQLEQIEKFGIQKQIEEAKEILKDNSKAMFTTDNFTDEFKNKSELKQTQIAVDYINQYADKNSDVAKLFTNLKKIDTLSSNNIPLSISHSKDYAVTTSYRTLSNTITSVKITVPKLVKGDIFLDSKMVTWLHENQHLRDVMLRPDVTAPGHHSSNFNKLIDAVKKQNSSIGADSKKVIEDFHTKINAVIQAETAKIKKELSKITDNYKNGKMTYTEYKKLYRKTKNSMYEDLKWACRSADVGVSCFEDIYDALSSGVYRDTGVVIYGHGSKYYASLENRLTEIQANYGALMIRRPDLIQLLKQDKPELVKALEAEIKDMVKDI